MIRRGQSYEIRPKRELAATQGPGREIYMVGIRAFLWKNLSQISGGEDHVRRSNDELAATRQRPVLPPAGFKGHRLASSQKWK